MTMNVNSERKTTVISDFKMGNKLLLTQFGMQRSLTLRAGGGGGGGAPQGAKRMCVLVGDCS